MNTIIVSTKEYKKLRDTRAMVEKKSEKEFSDVAFGILKDALGKSSSVSHIAKLRKSWRG